MRRGYILPPIPSSQRPATSGAQQQHHEASQFIGQHSQLQHERVGNNDRRQSLKRRLDGSSAIALHAASGTREPPIYSVSQATHAGRRSGTSSIEALTFADFDSPQTSALKPSPPPAARPSSSIGLSLSLADRRKMTTTQVSKHLGFSFSGAHRQDDHPGPADTIPSQTTPRNSVALARNRKSSEYARSFILPKAAPAPPSHRTKKEKYRPPLVNGGYADRLNNLYSYEKSEYSMWANANLRQDRTFGSTDPLATVEIKEIGRDHYLQWANCTVIPSSTNKPPFDFPIPTFDHEMEIEAEDVVLQATPQQRAPSDEIGIVRETPSQEVGSMMRRASVSASASVSQDVGNDSIGGLHMTMGGLVVLESSQGSEMGALRSQHMLPLGLSSLSKHGNTVGVSDEDSDDVFDPRLLKSSQGSEDGFDDGRDFDDRRLYQDSVDPRQGSGRQQQPTSSEHEEVVELDEIDEDQTPVPEEGCIVLRSTTALSSISEWSTDSAAGAFPIVRSTPLDPVKEKSVVEMILPKDGSEPAAGPIFRILFSNLFHWSTIKVADHVEIHEPCRRVFTPGSGIEGAEGLEMWIVERYRVVGPHG